MIEEIGAIGVTLEGRRIKVQNINGKDLGEGYIRTMYLWNLGVGEVGATYIHGPV